jgi:hypothetical protein
MDRVKLFQDIASGLSSKYNQIRDASLDSGLSGTSGENILREWIGQWMPKRISIKTSSVISVSNDPTNQMDCLLFDQLESPVFHNIGNIEILPIEGIVGGVEINFGENTTYQKILKDCDKLSYLAELSHNRLPRIGIPLSHIPFGEDQNTFTKEQIIKSLTFHRSFDGKPILLIFAEQLNGTLEEAAKRIMQHNKNVGPKKSIDGLFILKQGLMLHISLGKNGWTTQRMNQSKLGILKAPEGQVLLKFQSIILQHLYLTGKTYPQGFDSYVTQTNQVKHEMDNLVEISDSGYVNQNDPDSTTII